ncbi:MAG: Mut7-C ubiquitin/RNAse domain-containing protein [Ardenticatenales bacterium]|nr:Mut7-C ubiquitin/RNAse domain-containing protein [Ardenticatenales bacterium]
MAHASFRFHDELNDFLPASRRAQRFVHEFDGTVSIKDMIESLGVPHPEVFLILVNGQSVDFSYPVQSGEQIAIYPLAQARRLGMSSEVEPPPLDEYRFILDAHLGRLAAHLRMLGFDTLYRNDYDDEELALVSSREQRILLSRDLGVLKRGIVTYGYFVRETNPERQVVEILRRYNLPAVVEPFKRCTRCNGLLLEVRKEEIYDRLPAETKQHYDDFRLCQSCDQVYWRGSHFQRIQQFIDGVIQDAQER